MIKRKGIGFLLMILLILSGICVSAEVSVNVYVNESVLQSDATPFIVDGRTMVPMRSIFETLGAEVSWDVNTRKIQATKGDIKIALQIDNNTLYQNERTVMLEVAPTIIGDRTFVPLRAVSESLSADVEWAEDIKTVYINSPDMYQKYKIASKDEFVTVYSADGKSVGIIKSELDSYISNGWYKYPVATMYSADGRTTIIAAEETELYLSQGWYQYPVTTMYAPDGRTTLIYTEEISLYESQGWYQYPVITLYAADGRTTVVHNDELQVQLSRGWYQWPVVTMYKGDGSATLIYKSEIEAYNKKGWYEYPVVTMYAPDGRTTVINKEEVEDYKMVGWYIYPVSTLKYGWYDPNKVYQSDDTVIENGRVYSSTYYGTNGGCKMISGNVPLTVNNFGNAYILRGNKWYYFLYHGSDNIVTELYSADKSGKNKIMLSDKMLQDAGIYVIGDYLYYVGYSNAYEYDNYYGYADGGIFRINLINNVEEKIIDDKHIIDFEVLNDRIYYVKIDSFFSRNAKRTTYMTDLNGHNISVIDGEIPKTGVEFFVRNNKITYKNYDNGKEGCFDIKLQTVTSTDSFSHWVIGYDENYIYYISMEFLPNLNDRTNNRAYVFRAKYDSSLVF